MIDLSQIHDVLACFWGFWIILQCSQIDAKPTPISQFFAKIQMSCFRAYTVPKTYFNQLKMAIVVEKIEEIIKFGPETAEIEHFHSKKGAPIRF